MTAYRSSLTLLEGILFSLISAATLSYLAENRNSYGLYFAWKHIGASTLLVLSGVTSWIVRIKICDRESYGYFTVFIISAFFIVLSKFSLAHFVFKYDDTDRKVNWSGVSNVLSNGHNVYIFILVFYIGVCVSFQFFWEFWYLDGLEASPLVMAGAGLVRRPLLAVCIFKSCKVMQKLGELPTVSIGFFLFTAAFLALSFVRVYWYVLAIDILHSVGFGLAYNALTIRLSKIGSNANIGLLLGKYFHN